MQYSHLALGLTALTLVSLASHTAFGLDRVERTLPASTSDGTGSNGSVISTYGGTSAISYINTDNDSTTIGNSFSGSYYDSLQGSLRLNWSSIATKNVRIGQPTNRCTTGYGYELTGYAKSAVSGGLVNMAPSSTNYVYYCESTGRLHGFAYGSTTGWQNFTGIVLSAAGQSNLTPTELGVLNDPFNFNRSSSVYLSGTTLLVADRSSSLQGDVSGDSSGKEAVFYIIK